MKTNPSENDPLDALLRAPLPPLPSDAFTNRVMAALPARQRLPVSPLWWVLIGTVTGVMFAFTQGASWRSITDCADSLGHACRHILASTTDPWLILALITTALSLLMSFMINRLFVPHRI